LEFDCKHFAVPWTDVTAEEAWALKVLEQERGKWEKEQSDERAEQQRQEAAMRQMQARGKQEGGV
jgi:hypothetical protein